MRKIFFVSIVVMAAIPGKAYADRQCTITGTDNWCLYECSKGDLIEIVSEGEVNCISGGCPLSRTTCDVAEAMCTWDGDCPGTCTGCRAVSKRTASGDNTGFCFSVPGDVAVTTCRAIGTPQANAPEAEGSATSKGFVLAPPSSTLKE